MKSLRFLRCSLLLFLGLNPALPANAQEGPEMGAVIKLVGRAETARGPLRDGDPLYFGDTVTTPARGSWLRMSFDRDGEIWLGPNTRATLGPKEEPAVCDRPTEVAATVILQEGHVWVFHNGDLPTTGPQMVEVRTPTAVICMVGSTVDVKTRRNSSANDSRTFVLVSQGSVVLHPPLGGLRNWSQVHLAKGSLLAFDKRGPAQPIRVDLAGATTALAFARTLLFDNSPRLDLIDPRGMPNPLR
ncbi:MAG TPA: hypothetical protein VGS22_13190 [Thermoanaerobaculia bacterium]|jgi:hypothetical protein|nr:hypothetical protein [Thermoanaerobaculia bacterium]